MRLPRFALRELHALRLETKQLYLRCPRQQDWRAWAGLRAESRDFLIPWEPTWSHDALTRGGFRRRLKLYADEARQGGGYSFLIFRRLDDALLGGVTMTNLRRGVCQAVTLGYWIGAPYARHGYMYEALGAVVPFAFGELNLNRLEAACLPDNAASRALLLKLGFGEEGYARQYLRINGNWQDHLLFALVANDYRSAQSLGAAASDTPDLAAGRRTG
jgi:ribosomal-protein-alanine N-acetyltransferase